MVTYPATPAPAPSLSQFEVYTQNGPMPLGEGLYLTENGTIAVDASSIVGNVNGGTF